MRRVGTGESYVGEVPLEMFRGATFGEKRYLEIAEEIVMKGVEALRVSKSEPIRICTGYILSKAREALKEEGYNVVERRITGETQALAEDEFVKSLSRLGVGDLEEVAEMRSFDAFLEWVLEDLEERERFVKTGWKAWPRLRRGRTHEGA